MNYSLKMDLCTEYVNTLMMNLSKITKCIKILTLCKGIGFFIIMQIPNYEGTYFMNDEVTSKYLNKIKCI